MFPASQKVRVKQGWDVLGRHRSIGDARFTELNFDQWLEPASAPGAVAYELDFGATLLGFGREGEGNLVGSK